MTQLSESLATDVYVAEDGNNFRVSSQDPAKVTAVYEALKAIMGERAEDGESQAGHMSVKRVDNHLDVKSPLKTVLIDLRRAVQSQREFSSQPAPSRP